MFGNAVQQKMHLVGGLKMRWPLVPVGCAQMGQLTFWVPAIYDIDWPLAHFGTASPAEKLHRRSRITSCANIFARYDRISAFLHGIPPAGPTATSSSSGRKVVAGIRRFRYPSILATCALSCSTRRDASPDAPSSSPLTTFDWSRGSSFPTRGIGFARLAPMARKTKWP